jgi:hypothetical protein
VRPLAKRPPISRPIVTAALDASSAATPAARLVIQKMCSGSIAQDWAVVTASEESPVDDDAPRSWDASLDPSDVAADDPALVVEAVSVAALPAPIEPVAAIAP